MNIIIPALLVILLVLVVTFSSLKLKKEANTENNMNRNTMVTIIILATFWMILTIGLAAYLVFTINPDSRVGGIYFFGTFAFSGFLSGIIMWTVWIRAIKNSNESKEVKTKKYIDNNLLYGMGGAFIVEGIITSMLFVLAIIPSVKVDNSFHPIRLILGVIWFVVPMYLMVKLIQWVRDYAQKLI